MNKDWGPIGQEVASSDRRTAETATAVAGRHTLPARVKIRLRANGADQSLISRLFDGSSKSSKSLAASPAPKHANQPPAPDNGFAPQTVSSDGSDATAPVLIHIIQVSLY
jgi:hypothetical protein